MSERHKDTKPKDPRINVPEPFEHISTPVDRLMKELKAKMEAPKRGTHKNNQA